MPSSRPGIAKALIFGQSEAYQVPGFQLIHSLISGFGRVSPNVRSQTLSDHHQLPTLGGGGEPLCFLIRWGNANRCNNSGRKYMELMSQPFWTIPCGEKTLTAALAGTIHRRSAMDASISLAIASIRPGVVLP